MKSKKPFVLRCIIFVGVMGLILIPAYGLAAESDPDKDAHKPERLIEMAVEYPGVEITPDEDVTMDVIFYNKGKSEENVDVSVTKKPTGWKARLKTYRYTVTAVHVPAGENKTLTFEADPEKDTKIIMHYTQISVKQD